MGWGWGGGGVGGGVGFTEFGTGCVYGTLFGLLIFMSVQSMQVKSHTNIHT